ncbi:MAG: hypothetical protein ACI4F8_11220 [Lachnospiraceae bacterium]
MKSKHRICVSILLLFVIVACFSTAKMTAYAVEKPVLLVTSYTIKSDGVVKDKVVRGETFQLDITITNYGKETDAENVYVQLFGPNKILPKFGTAGQYYVGTICAGKTATVSVEYTVDASYAADVVDFSVNVYSDAATQVAYLAIPCGSDSPFLILESNIPTTVTKGDQVETSVTFKVLGDDNVSNVSVIVTSDGNVIDNSYIGILTPGVTKTQKVSISFSEEGTIPVELYLQYADYSGTKKAVCVNAQTVKVGKSTGNSSTESSWGDTSGISNNAGADKLILMGACGLSIFIIILVVVYLLSKKRR